MRETPLETLLKKHGFAKSDVGDLYRSLDQIDQVQAAVMDFSKRVDAVIDEAMEDAGLEEEAAPEEWAASGAMPTEIYVLYCAQREIATRVEVDT